MEEEKGREVPPRTPSHLSYMQVGLHELKSGQVPQAIRNLKKSVRLLEEDRNRFLLGVAFLLNRDFRDALAQVRRPISDPTLHVKGRYVQALAQGESGLTDQALEQLDAITRLEPGMADAYVSKGALFASEGRIDLATEAWKEGVDNAGQTARLLACEGFALLASGRAQDAVFALTKAARHNPSDTVAKFFLAAAFSKIGNHSGAVKAFTEYLRLEPASPQALYFRARLHAKLGNMDDSVKDFSGALRYDAGCIAALVGRAAALVTMEKLDSAVADLEAALARVDFSEELVPLFTPSASIADASANTVPIKDLVAPVGTLLANLLLQQKKYGAARKALDTVLRVAPGAAKCWYYRSVCSERLGDVPTAMRDINKALKLDKTGANIIKRRRYLMYKCTHG